MTETPFFEIKLFDFLEVKAKVAISIDVNLFHSQKARLQIKGIPANCTRLVTRSNFRWYAELKR